MLKQLATMFVLISTSLSTNASDDLVLAGESIFRTTGGYGCIACHGLYAQGGGNVGGNIRGKSLAELKNSLKNEETMQLLDSALSHQEKVSLAHYLESLGKWQLVDWVFEGGTSEISVLIENNVKGQLVVLNKTFEPMSIDLSPLANERLTLNVAPYETKSFEWIPQKGAYALSYGNQIINIDVK